MSFILTFRSSYYVIADTLARSHFQKHQRLKHSSLQLKLRKPQLIPAMHYPSIFFFTCLQLNVGQQSRHTASKECSTHMQNPAKEQKGPLFTHFIGSLLTLAARPAGYQKNFRRYGTTARPGELCLCFFLSNGPRNIIVAPCPRKCDRSHSNGPLPNFLLCCLKTMIFPFFFFCLNELGLYTTAMQRVNANC